MSTADTTILLFGMPRSGTTWIGKIFDSHPTTLYMHEPDSWRMINDLPLFAEHDPSEGEIAKIRTFVSALPAIRNSKVTGKLPAFRKSYQSMARFRSYLVSVYAASLCRKLFNGCRIDPLARRSAHDKANVGLVWKSIESLGRLRLFANALENTHCVHIVRNPAGYIASVMRGEAKKTFSTDTATSEDYALYEMLLSTTSGQAAGYKMADIKSMHPIERLAVRWRLYNEIAYFGCHGLSNYRLQRYEDICRAPVETSRALFKFCGLTWSEQTEQFLTASVSQNNDAYYSVYKSPLKAAYKWQNDLSDEQVKMIKDTLSDSTAFSWYLDDFAASRL